MARRSLLRPSNTPAVRAKNNMFRFAILPLPLLLLVQCAPWSSRDASAFAFSPNGPMRTITTRTWRKHQRQRPSPLSAADGNNDESTEQINPNDLETAEERAARMQLVKQIQKSFYADASGAQKETTTGTFDDVGLWRVQWTELPGYQNVLNVHVAHYTHMFQSVVNGPRPWYFGHLYLPGGSENLENEEYRLCGEDSKQTRWGTLMKVSDYQQLDEDGRLLLIVQAVGKYKVTSATQHTPYSIAKVCLIPDRELICQYYQMALEKIESGLGLSVGGNFDIDGKAQEKVAWEAARVICTNEMMYWEDFEYRDVKVSDTINGGVEASPLANYNAERIPTSPFDADKALDDFVAEFSSKVNNGDLRIDTLPSPPESIDLDDARKMTAKVLELEKEVWKDLDFLIQLLMILSPGTNVPVPTQLLGLLPTDEAFPEGFKLNAFVDRLNKEKALVGTASKSPFVSVCEAAPDYPPLRRAQRLSFAVWVLLDNVLAGYGPAGSIRQDVLELESIEERLDAALRGLNALNSSLKKTLEQR